MVIRYFSVDAVDLWNALHVPLNTNADCSSCKSNVSLLICKNKCYYFQLVYIIFVYFVIFIFCIHNRERLTLLLCLNIHSFI